MQAVTTIGFDIAKSVFQVHGVDTVGQVIIRRQLKRRQVIAFFPEAAGVPGRHRGVRLISSLVARAAGAWAQRAANAAGLCEAVRQAPEERHGRPEAICEAVTRANMRFVPTKTAEQQSGLMCFIARAICSCASRPQ